MRKNCSIGVVELRHPIGVHRRLVGVAVEVAPAGFEHAEAEIGVDQMGGDLEPADEPVGRIGRKDRCQRRRQVDLIAERARQRVVPRTAAGRRGDRPDRVVHPEVLGRGATAEARTARWDGRRPALLTEHVERHAGADRRRGVQVGPAGQVAVEPASDPSRARDPGADAAHPDRHRVEVAEVGVRVADALDDGQLAGVPEPLQRGEPRVETDSIVELQCLCGGDGERAVLRVVVGVGERHECVEAVVAAVHPDDQEDPLVRPDGRCRPGLATAEGLEQ